jgi:SOS-response transcriptional repressor LexA
MTLTTIRTHQDLRRRDEILQFICLFARENSGVSPSIRVIARHMGLGKSTVAVHLKILEDEERISWVEGRLKVERSTWEEPPDVDI